MFPVIKWCVDVNTSIAVPFQIGKYELCVRGLSIELSKGAYAQRKIPDIVHIILQPSGLASNIYFGSLAMGYCIKTLCLGGHEKMAVVFSSGDREVHEVDLTAAPTYNLCVVDSEGYQVSLKGGCVLELVKAV